MYSIGIDPGVNGAITILDNNGSHLETHVMPMVIVEDSSYKHWYKTETNGVPIKDLPKQNVDPEL